MRPARAVAAIVAFVLAGGVLAGCAPTVHMNPAGNANDARCADVTVRLPDSIAGKKQRQTDAQATGAWGNPVAVLLRCGVPPIGPTTKPCVSADGIDWVLETSPSSKVFRYITFGRTPATEVVIQHGAGGVSDATALASLAQAIASVKQTQKCS